MYIIPYSRLRCVCAQWYSTLCDPWPVAQQALLSMGFSWQEYWCGLPFPSPGDLLYPGTEPASPALQVDSLLLGHLGNHLISVYIFYFFQEFLS